MLQKVGQSKGFSFLRVIAITAAVLILAGLLFPAHTGCGPTSLRQQARIDVTQLVSAVKAYDTEYGRLPLAERQRAFTDETSQARLLRVLRALDVTYNPRRVVFFETRDAVPKRRWWFQQPSYCAGLHPTLGAFLDPWGQPYRILLDSDHDGKIQSPYQDDEEIHTSFIVWSVGKDGVQGSPGKKNILKESDDVISWR
ncbi:hypothetical protein ACXR0O_27310 [Verrucomicrobiota bacterium sgz303538]